MIEQNAQPPGNLVENATSEGISQTSVWEIVKQRSIKTIEKKVVDMTVGTKLKNAMMMNVATMELCSRYF